MPLFRVIAMVLPLLLISLLVAGSKDMLGGWNQTDNALSTVLTLFLLGPVVTLSLLVTEIVRYYKKGKGSAARLCSSSAWRYFSLSKLSPSIFTC